MERGQFNLWLLEHLNNVLKALGSFPLLCLHPHFVGSDLMLAYPLLQYDGSGSV